MIFWTPVDGCISEYVKMNTSLIAASTEYEYIFVCSGNISSIIRDMHPKSTVIECDNNMGRKGNIAYDIARESDLCIRIDADSIIFDLTWLVGKANQIKGKKAVIGNVRTTEEGITYVRGGCKAISRQAMESMRYLPEYKRDYDMAFREAILGKNIEMINGGLFELSKNFQKTCPVWHPPKSKKMQYFSATIEKYFKPS